MLGGLLETTIKPVGPYLIVLWTRYSDQAPALREFLEDRLQDVEKPFDVLPLAKADHLDDAGGIRNEDALMDAIVQITQSLPQVGALFDWESRVLEAAGDTLSSILKLASTQAKDKQADDIGKILASLGSAAVGEAHVQSDRFRAVNEALLPILADRIANLPSGKSDEQVWKTALDIGSRSDLSLSEAARLNRLVHVADPASDAGPDRGMVLALPEFLENGFQAAGMVQSSVRVRRYGSSVARQRPLSGRTPVGSGSGRDAAVQAARTDTQRLDLPRSRPWRPARHDVVPGIDDRPAAPVSGNRAAGQAQDMSDRTTVSITGGQTPFPRSRIRSRRVPTGSRKSSPNPMARLSSGTCSMRIRHISPSCSISANRSIVVIVRRGRSRGCQPPHPSVP